MKDLSPEQFKQAYGRLPLPIREYLTGDDLGVAAGAIGQSHNMHVDTTGTLADIISQTLLGFIPPQELPSVLMKELNLPEADALTLITDINQKVFIPLQKKVREDVAKTQAEAAEDQPKQKIVPVASVPMPQPGAPTTAPVTPQSQPPRPQAPITSGPPPRPASPLPAAGPTAPVRLPVQPHYATPPVPQTQPQPSASVSAPAAQNIHIYVGPQTHAPAPQPIIQPIMMQPISAPLHAYPQMPQAPAPIQMTSRPAPAAQAPQPVPPQLPEFHPAARTMASDMQLAKDMRQGIVRPQEFAPEAPRPMPAPAAQPPVTHGPPTGSDPYREPPTP